MISWLPDSEVQPVSRRGANRYGQVQTFNGIDVCTGPVEHTARTTGKRPGTHNSMAQSLLDTVKPLYEL